MVRERRSGGFRDALRKGKGPGYTFLVLLIQQQILIQVGTALFILYEDLRIALVKQRTPQPSRVMRRAAAGGTLQRP